MTDQRRERFYVVAGTWEQYRYYVRKKLEENPADLTEYTYVTSVHQLRGLNQIKGCYYGTFDDRHDIDEIKQQITIIKTMHSPFKVLKV